MDETGGQEPVKRETARLADLPVEGLPEDAPEAPYAATDRVPPDLDPEATAEFLRLGYAPYLEALGLPGITDLHVHFMPANVQEKVWAFFDTEADRGGPPWHIEYRQSDEERTDPRVLVFLDHDKRLILEFVPRHCWTSLQGVSVCANHHEGTPQSILT